MYTGISLSPVCNAVFYKESIFFKNVPISDSGKFSMYLITKKVNTLLELLSKEKKVMTAIWQKIKLMNNPILKLLRLVVNFLI